MTRSRCSKGNVFSLLCFAALLLFSSAVHAADPWKSFGAIRLPAKAAPPFSLPSFDGTKVALEDHRGQVVLLNFWASWCPGCRVEMPSMERLYAKYKEKGFVILAVNMMEPAKKVQKFSKEQNLTFPIPLDSRASLRALYPHAGLPASFFIDRKGNIRGQVIGSREWDVPAAEMIITELLDEEP